MFTNVELAKRVEAAETELILRLAEAARLCGRDASVVRIGAGAVVFGGENAPFNKMVGVGFEPLDELALLRAEREHDARGAPLRAEVSTLAEPALFEGLSRRGYALAGFEHVLGTAPREGGEAEPGSVLVRAAREDEYELWQRTVVDGFAAPDGSAPETESFPREALEAVFRELARLHGLVRVLASLGGETVGGAGLFTSGDVALLAGAATLPAFRRRGVQRALLDARLAMVARAGCALAVVTTQPGSQSQSNVQRAGFELLYARAVMVRAPRK